MERYREKVGSYPVSLTNLFPSYLQPVPSLSQSHWDRWSYERGFTTGYSLYYKLSWDAGLFYEHKIDQTNRWYFDPGNGNELTDLSAELEQK